MMLIVFLNDCNDGCAIKRNVQMMLTVILNECKKAGVES